MLNDVATEKDVVRETYSEDIWGKTRMFLDLIAKYGLNVFTTTGPRDETLYYTMIWNADCTAYTSLNFCISDLSLYVVVGDWQNSESINDLLGMERAIEGTLMEIKRAA